MRLLLILPCFFLSPVWGQQWAWLQQIGGKGYENIVDMCTAPGGDVVLAGSYEDRQSSHLPSRDGRAREFPALQMKHPGDATSMWLARYRPDGSLRWAACGLAEEGFSVRDVHTDAQGNVLVCGQYRGQMRLLPSVGKEYTLQAERIWLISGTGLAYNPFVAKFSPEGRLLWCKTGFARADAAAFQVLTDDAGNVYSRLYNTRNSLCLTKFMLLPDIGPDGYHTADNKDTHALVVVKYSPDGEEQWVTYGGGSIGVKEMQVSPDGQVILQMRMSLSPKICLFHTDGSRWKYDLSLNRLRVGQIHLNVAGKVVAIDTVIATWSDFQGDVLKTVCDRNGDRYVLLQGERNDRVWPPVYELKWKEKTYQYLRNTIYLGKTSADGTPLWLVRLNGNQDGQDLESRPSDLILDAQQQPVVGGWFHLRMQVTDPAGGTAAMLANPMGFSLFVARFTQEGQLLHAEPLGTSCFLSIESLSRLSLAPSQDSAFFVCCEVNRSTTMGGYAIAPQGQGRIFPRDTEPCFDYPDVFFAKYGTRPDAPLVSADTATQDTLPTASLAAVPPASVPLASALAPAADSASSAPVAALPLDLLLFPNPVTQQQRSLSAVLTFSEATALRWEITDMSGRTVLRRESRCSGSCTEEFSFEGLPAGVYLLIVRSPTQQATRRIVVL